MPSNYLCNHRSTMDAAPPPLSFHRALTHEQTVFAHLVIRLFQIFPAVFVRLRPLKMLRLHRPESNLETLHWKIRAFVPEEFTYRLPHAFFSSSSSEVGIRQARIPVPVQP